MKEAFAGMLKNLNTQLDDENGQTLIEYALIFVGVAGLIIAGIVIYGQEIVEMYNAVTNFFQSN